MGNGASPVLPSESASYYASLIRPSWAPPAWLFGPVWTVLYILIAVSFGYVFWKVFKRDWTTPIAIPFALNLFFNLMFTPIQFKLRSNALATVDIILVLASLSWGLWTTWPMARWVSLINLPYLLWVCFATVLQLTITWMNR